MITVNGLPVLELRLTLPLVGAWVAELEVDTSEVDDPPTGQVAIADDGGIYNATVVRSGILAHSARLDVVGGKGGLSQDVAARSFRDASARDVAADILAQVGEELDPSSTPAVLSIKLPYWTVTAGRAGAALSALCDALSARWRVLPSGGVWIGVESWPAAERDALELDRDDAAGAVFTAPDDLAVLAPGSLLSGRNVGRVEYLVTREQPLRATYWTESPLDAAAAAIAPSGGDGADLATATAPVGIDALAAGDISLLALSDGTSAALIAAMLSSSRAYSDAGNAELLTLIRSLQTGGGTGRTSSVAVSSTVPVYVPAITGRQQTASIIADERGVISFNPALYKAVSGFTRSIIFAAELEAAVAGQSCYLELYNLTDAVSVVTLNTAQTLPTRVVSSELSLPQSSKLYSVRLWRVGGSGSEQVACKMARFEVSYA